mgnify:CR=1 FL=1
MKTYRDMTDDELVTALTYRRAAHDRALQLYGHSGLASDRAEIEHRTIQLEEVQGEIARRNKKRLTGQIITDAAAAVAVFAIPLMFYVGGTAL